MGFVGEAIREGIQIRNQDGMLLVEVPKKRIGKG